MIVPVMRLHLSRGSAEADNGLDYKGHECLKADMQDHFIAALMRATTKYFVVESPVDNHLH